MSQLLCIVPSADLRLWARPTLALQPIAGLEYPPNDHEAPEQERKGHPQADRDAHIGNLEKGPTEAADEINNRIEKGDSLPCRWQHADRIEAAAQERERRDDEERNDLQLLEAVRPDPDDETEQAECHRGEHQESHHPGRVSYLERHEQ